MKIAASAPSNIALIKYMGKASEASNLPVNPSLSLTLENLRSFITLESSSKPDAWTPLVGYPEVTLSERGHQKFLAHFARLKELWKIKGNYTISSANNFPADCGIASSASSYAALTRATHDLAVESGTIQVQSAAELSRLSRLGSGSSCRSFFSPWALWKGEGAEALPLNVKVEHAVILVGEERKEVSSSEAHLRVNGSMLFEGRVQRATARLELLIQALQNGNWKSGFEICWAEFWDMHALFETSQPSFGYMNSDTLTVLELMRGIWRRDGDGPIVTMDAGPNVHVLLRPDQTAKAAEWLQSFHHIKSWS